MSTSLQVGSVTLEEIMDALQTSGGELTHKVFYSKVTELHCSKIGKCTTRQLLDNMAQTRNLLEVCKMKHNLQMEWIVHLYDTMIATGSLLTVINRKDNEPEVE